MSKFVILLCAVLGFAVVSCEKPGPYPPKGWKPQGARLELPRQYGTPQRNAAPEEVEFTTVVNDYLPPTTIQSDENDVLRVQGLPAADSVSEFRTFQQKKKAANVQVQPQAARIQFAPAPAFAGQPLLLSPVFAPQFAPVSGQLQEQRFNQQVQSFNPPPQSDAQQVPRQAYGPPQANVPEQRTNEPEVVQNEQPEQPESDENDDEDQDEPVIAVSNVVSNGDASQGQVGQYYILLPDQSLQKVRFATKQTDEDRQINGFSAQLRYSPVEAIKDPVFGYDEQGKLVRLYK